MPSSRTITTEDWNKVSSDTWVNGVQKSMTLTYCASATVSSNQAVFYLTDNGASNGNAVFTTVYKESANFWVDDATNQYQFGSYTLSEDKKSITVTVNRLGTVLLGIIQFITGADGTMVYLTVRGE